jgi:hypothetical protein
MKIGLYEIKSDKPSINIDIDFSNKMFIVTPNIYDNLFLHLYDELLFIRTKWHTFYLNYMNYEPSAKSMFDMKKGLVDDILEMLEHEIISCKLNNTGTYKIICSNL